MSVTRQRYYFRALVQKKGEKICDWERRLRKAAKNCNFTSIDEQIFDQIVEKTNFNMLRREAFKTEMDLTQLLNLAAKLENRMDKCTRCGSEDHPFYAAYCPALRNRCEICKVVGHFSKFCFKNIPKRRSELPVTVEIKKVKYEEKFDSKEETETYPQEQADPTPNISVKDPRMIKNKNFVEPESKPLPPNIPKDGLSKVEKKVTCNIGDVLTKVTISDEYMVNVISKKLFDNHKIKCSIHGNKEVTINGHKYTAALETRVERNGNHILAEFYFSEEIKEEKCVITSHVAKKLCHKP